MRIERTDLWGGGGRVSKLPARAFWIPVVLGYARGRLST